MRLALPILQSYIDLFGRASGGGKTGSKKPCRPKTFRSLLGKLHPEESSAQQHQLVVGGLTHSLSSCFADKPHMRCG